MNQISFSINPQDAIRNLLKALPSRRMRDIVEKRFGLRGGRRKTLEAVGKEYKITRERVRQIEVEALKRLRQADDPANAALLKSLEDFMRGGGDVWAEKRLLGALGEPRMTSHFLFLLEIGRQFSYMPESADFYARWTTDKQKISGVEKMMLKVLEELSKKGLPVAEGELFEFAARCAKDFLGQEVSSAALANYIAASKAIGKNPYGEYGLVSWSSVRPRGVRDKAHAVLEKSGKPMHFREVAHSINQVGWSKRKAHPQTVHNELIKDNRFVLVGRGLYALRNWGYEPGVVRDVVLSVLKNAAHPLAREEIVRLVSEKRMVKPQTIILNLQNRSLFRRTDEGMYALA